MGRQILIASLPFKTYTLLWLVTKAVRAQTQI